MPETIKSFAPSWKTAISHSDNHRTLVARLFPCLILLLASGCSDNSSIQPPARDPKGKVIIKGSNTVGEELAPRLVAEYKKEHPEFGVDIETKGSASGFWGLIAGVCDVAAASRSPIKDEQLQAETRKIPLTDNVIGSYSIAVVVNAKSPVNDLSKERVKQIFQGSVQNWKEVGGPDAPIHLYVRNPISGTYLGFRELALADQPYSTNITSFTNYAGIAQAVANDPSGIGYTSFQSASKPGVKAVTIEGIAPVAASVKEGKYPFARTLHFYTNKDKESESTRQFIDFVQSPKGQAIVDEMGFVRR